MGDSPYTREITTKFLLAAVTRIYEPGAKFDNMLTLVGNQGEGKSSIFMLLAGIEWFNTIKTVEDKEACEVLDVKWIIEMAD